MVTQSTSISQLRLLLPLLVIVNVCVSTSPVFKSADNESGDIARLGVVDVRLYEKPPPPLLPPE